jgi:hypothetical protein
MFPPAGRRVTEGKRIQVRATIRAAGHHVTVIETARVPVIVDPGD